MTTKHSSALTAPEQTSHVSEIVDRAHRASPIFAATHPSERASLLLGLADALEASRDTLLDIALRETGLTEPRLTAEITRTAVQLRAFADEVLRGDHLDARIDLADPDFVIGPKPDIRRTHLPLGPIVNFAASNFPFAFSVLGGDTASILAAGCPVILKAHEAHAELSVATAEVAQRVVSDHGLPEGVFQLIRGREAGVAALRDPRVRGGAFTGSIGGGRALADIAAARPAPIPFYGELGSVNPVVVTSAALAERANEVATGYVASVSGSAGQLCTKPGFLFLPEGHTLTAAIADAAAQVPEHRLLDPRIGEQYIDRRETVIAQPGVSIVAEGAVRLDAETQVWATPTIVQVGLEDFIAGAGVLSHETFGPFSVMVTYPEGANLAEVIATAFEGNLAMTLHHGAEETSGTGAEALRPLVAQMSQQAGRVLFNGWPTGVAVTPAMTHGGPWPATTNDTSTSVGMAAIARWQRPVTFQNAPAAFVTADLRDHAEVRQRVTTPADTAGWAG